MRALNMALGSIGYHWETATRSSWGTILSHWQKRLILCESHTGHICSIQWTYLGIPKYFLAILKCHLPECDGSTNCVCWQPIHLGKEDHHPISQDNGYEHCSGTAIMVSDGDGTTDSHDDSGDDHVRTLDVLQESFSAMSISDANDTSLQEVSWMIWINTMTWYILSNHL